MQYRLLALDIDGTLLDSKSQLRPRVKQAVRKAQAAGMRVCLASGRGTRSLTQVAWELGITEPCVSYNGAVISELGSARPLRVETISKELVLPVLDEWRRAKIPVFAYRDCPNPPDVFFQQYPSWPLAQAFIMEQAGYVRQVADIARETDWEPVRLAVSDSEELTQQAMELALPHLDTKQVRLLRTRHYEESWYLELESAHVSKATGVNYLCQSFGIDPAEVIAVGDHLNDLDVIKFAGLGVAMGNAQPELKAVADLVIGHHDEDGLAEFIERLVASDKAIAYR